MSCVQRSTACVYSLFYHFLGEALKPDHAQLKAVAQRDTVTPFSSKPPDSFPVGDKEKQGRKTKQASGRKQQAKMQPRTQTQQQGTSKTTSSSKTSAANRSVTDKVDLLQHRESSDSVTSIDSTSSAKSRDENEKSRADNDNTADEVASELPKIATIGGPSEDARITQAPPLDSSVAAPKKEHPPQQTRKEKKRKAKVLTSPTTDSQKTFGRPPLQSAEQAEPLDREISAHNELPFEGEQLVAEEPRASKAVSEVESTMAGKPGQKEKKVKTADSLDDILPGNPVVLKISKGNTPKVPAKSKHAAAESTTSASDPFSKRVDKTSYISKKAGARRMRSSPDIHLRSNASDTDADLEKRQPSSETNSERDQSPGSPSSERAGDFFVRQQVESHDCTDPPVEGTEVEESVAYTRTYAIEEEGDEKNKAAQLLEVKSAALSSTNPRATSPHELAASVLRQQAKKADSGTEEPATSVASSQSKKRATAVHEDMSRNNVKLDEEEQMFYTAASPMKVNKGHPYSARIVSRPSKPSGKLPQPGVETQEATLAFPQVTQLPPSSVITHDPAISGTYVATVQEPHTQALYVASSAPTPSTPGRYQYSKPANTLGDYMPQGVMSAGRSPGRPAAEVIQDGTMKYSHFTGTGGVMSAASGKLRKVPAVAMQQDPSLQTPGYYPTSGGVPVSDQHGRVTVELPSSTHSGGYALSSQSAAGSIAPHMYQASVAASRKRPSHLELPQNVMPQQIALLANMQAKAEGFASLQDKLQQQQQQQRNQASLQYAYNQLRAQQQGMRYQVPQEYHPMSQATLQNTTPSPFGLLNTLTTHPMMYGKTLAMEKQPPTPTQSHLHTTDLGGEYLPISSKLATPNLAPGASSSKMDPGSIGRRDMGWQDEKVRRRQVLSCAVYSLCYGVSQ